jgi:Tfp pilus assembly protein PilP
MTTIIAAASALYVVLVSLLLIAGCFENAANIQQAMAKNSNSSQSTHINKAALNAVPPEKMTITGQSKPPVLSPEKKQVLEQDQAKIHHNPQLSSSDQAILGPIPGTQAQ